MSATYNQQHKNKTKSEINSNKHFNTQANKENYYSHTTIDYQQQQQQFLSYQQQQETHNSNKQYKSRSSNNSKKMRDKDNSRDQIHVKQTQQQQQQINSQSNNMVFAQPNISFFQEIYANYTQIWQQVLKLTLINNSLVDVQSFEKILRRVGIDTENQYCQFLLETCQVSEPINENTNTSNFQNIKLQKEKLIDYKFFLNSAIKALSLEAFDNETFILEQFWKTKFGDQSQRQVSIEEFNQAFYQFFNKENRLLSIDFIDQIINECFSYLLKKNKKFISKRSFRKVIKRNFRDIFNLILFNLNQKAIRNSQHKQLSANKQKELKIDPSTDIVGHCIQTTYYPDSLDMRSMLQQSKPNLITKDQSKSLYETSTFYNYSGTANNRSKSSELTNNNPSYQPATVHNTSLLHQQSTFDMLAQKVGLLADKTYDNRQNAAKYLELTIQKVIRQFHLRTGLDGLKEFKIRGSRKNQQKSRNNLQQQDTNNTQSTDQHCQETQDNKINNKAKKQLLERQTFSFNNRNNKATQDVDHFNIQQCLSDVDDTVEPLELNPLGSYKTIANRLQSYASLQYSNSPSQYLKPIGSHNRSKDIPPSTKSHSIRGQQFMNHTARQSSHYKNDSTRQYPPIYPPQNVYTDREFENTKLRQNQQLLRNENVQTEQTDSSLSHINYQSSGHNDNSIRVIDQKLDDINTQATTNMNSRRFSQHIAPRQQQKNNSIKNQSSQQYQGNEYDQQYQNYPHSHQQSKQNYNQQLVKSLDRNPLNDVSQHELKIHTNNNKQKTAFNRKHSTGHISKNVKNTLTLDESKSLITDITPITIKNSTANNIRDIDQSTISKMIDLHTLQGREAAGSKYRKPKEQVYIEKKYKKSKEKIRTLLIDNANEKTKNQALQKCNFVLGEKIEQLEVQYKDLSQQIQNNQDYNQQLE